MLPNEKPRALELARAVPNIHMRSAASKCIPQAGLIGAAQAEMLQVVNSLKCGVVLAELA